ncbi:glyoxalase [Streptomyces sp. T-3]|nr:glyoxalase [Streptomyces sp. T-3]
MSANPLVTITYPVKDLDAAKALFGAALGVEPYIDEAYYVAYNADGQDIGLDPNGHSKGMTGPVPFWNVDDIHAHLKALVEAGATPVQEVQDVGGGRQIASVRDADGNMIGLAQG